jgi:Lecithin retinol acyltransferase
LATLIEVIDMYPRQLNPIRIIARAKRSLLGNHWGVQLANGLVVHLTTEGTSLVTLQAFAEGKPWRVIRDADPRRCSQIMRRVEAALQHPQPYRLLDRNCENFANELLGDPAESLQVQGTAVFVLLAIAIRALS